MSFAEETGRTQVQKCTVCGNEVEHEEVRHFTAPKNSFHWHAVAHRAPCGAHCAGGGCDYDEQDVHTPPFSACPRCGAINCEISQITERPDGMERAEIHHYTAEHLFPDGRATGRNCGDDIPVGTAFTSLHRRDFPVTAPGEDIISPDLVFFAQFQFGWTPSNCISGKLIL